MWGCHVDEEWTGRFPSPAPSPDGAPQRKESPCLRQQPFRTILQKLLIVAGLRRHSLAIRCRRFPDFTFYGDMRGKYCISLLKSSSV